MARVRRARLRFWSLHFLSEYHTGELLSQFSLSFKAQSFFFFLTLSGDMTDSIHPSLAYIKTTKKAPYLKILPSRAQIRLWPIYVLLSFFFFWFLFIFCLFCNKSNFISTRGFIQHLIVSFSSFSGYDIENVKSTVFLRHVKERWQIKRKNIIS